MERCGICGEKIYEGACAICDDGIPIGKSTMLLFLCTHFRFCELEFNKELFIELVNKVFLSKQGDPIEFTYVAADDTFETIKLIVR